MFLKWRFREASLLVTFSSSSSFSILALFCFLSSGVITAADLTLVLYMHPLLLFWFIVPVCVYSEVKSMACSPHCWISCRGISTHCFAIPILNCSSFSLQVLLIRLQLLFFFLVSFIMVFYFLKKRVLLCILLMKPSKLEVVSFCCTDYQMRGNLSQDTDSHCSVSCLGESLIPARLGLCKRSKFTSSQESLGAQLRCTVFHPQIC